MNESEFKAINKRLEAMSRRVDRVLKKESLGKPMPLLDFKPREVHASKVDVSEVQTPRPLPRDIPRDVPRGRYRANEARLWDLNGREWPSQAERCDCPRPSVPGIVDEIFAGFEAEFDQMASKWRA